MVTNVPPYATVVGVPGHVIAYHDPGNDTVVRLPDPEWDRIEDLENVTATGTGQKTPVRLGSLITIRSTTQAVEFNHDGLKRVVDVQVNTENRDIGGVAADIARTLKGMDLPKGMRIELKGESMRKLRARRAPANEPLDAGQRA